MDTVKGTFFKWDRPSSFADRLRKRLDREAAYQKACKVVDGRDEGRCRACGKVVPVGQRHHHHLVPRSKGRDDSTSNVVLLCGLCHDQVHGARTLMVEGNADVAVCIARRGEDGRWFQWKQEVGIRQYVEVD